MKVGVPIGIEILRNSDTKYCTTNLKIYSALVKLESDKCTHIM